MTGPVHGTAFRKETPATGRDLRAGPLMRFVSKLGTVVSKKYKPEPVSLHARDTRKEIDGYGRRERERKYIIALLLARRLERRI